MQCSVLSPQTWPFGLEWLPPASYLVGGNVRDALLGRQADYLDLDFVMPQGAVETARAIATHFRAGFVLLDEERQIARVVFRAATVDFAQQVGDTLEADLLRRDFTVNAIAYNPVTDAIIDPLQGYADLQRRQIRMIAPENLKEDPLRLLRAYRQAAQLSFTLEPETRFTIQNLADSLRLIASERVQAEINYLLSTASGTPFLALAWEDGLLESWLPHVTASRLQQLAAIDHGAIALAERWPQFGNELMGWLRDQHKVSGAGRSWVRVAKLATLTTVEVPLAEQELRHLKYSRAEIQSVLTAIRHLPDLIDLATQVPALAKDQYLFFQQVGPTFPAVVLLAVAHGIPLEAIAVLIHHFLTPNDPIAHPQAPITGRDLMTALQLPPSPHIGKLLEAIQLAQAEGIVTNAQEALEFARQQHHLGNWATSS
ncbi:CCA tRNA nucleotidyltransferase [Leptolyngbya sp. AN02str]|uniref:CCA tRNA nucleotidyltransferase n=1 Tax=Leptolyngbya sp. AN02str TaxID=3423363 RepID=UPI003D31D25E